jgi:hypothetical protein
LEGRKWEKQFWVSVVVGVLGTWLQAAKRNRLETGDPVVRASVELIKHLENQRASSTEIKDQRRKLSKLLRKICGYVCWLTPVILATQEVEIGRIAVRGQPR